MRVAVLGSGSRGNAVAVETQDGTLLIDAGFGPRSLSRRAKDAGISIDSVVGIVLTHEHGDHAREAAALARRFDCPLYGSTGTLAALEHRLDGVRVTRLETCRPARISPFSVTVCLTSHDAAEPLAVAVEGPTGSKLGVAYDLGRATAAVRYLLRGSHCLIVEANHDDLLLRTGPYPAAVRQRIAGTGGHLSNRAAAELIASLCHDALEFVVLAHLSDTCNRPEIARTVVRDALEESGFGGSLLVASQAEPLHQFDVTGPRGRPFFLAAV